jgi:hypothetical protein
MRGWIQSEVHKVHNYYFSSRSWFVSFLASGSRLVPTTTSCWPVRIGQPALDDITQRGNQVLRITKSLAGPDEGIPNGDDVHRTSHQLGCFCLPPHDRLSPVLFRSSVILRGYGVPALPKPLPHFSTFFAQTLPALVLSIPNLAP